MLARYGGLGRSTVPPTVAIDHSVQAQRVTSRWPRPVAAPRSRRRPA
jgi:hypothetical protein